MLRLRSADLDAVRAHCRRDAPREACGVLVGRREGGVTVVEQAFPTRNASARPTAEYALDPEELLRVLLHAEEDLGLEVVGFYHSHPEGPPHPSGLDAARASWPGAAHLLVWLAPEEGCGGWTWDEARALFAPEELVVERGAAFVIDTAAGRIHRAATATAACGIEAIPPGARQEAADELKATMVMKTRHFAPCPHCW